MFNLYNLFILRPAFVHTSICTSGGLGMLLTVRLKQYILQCYFFKLFCTHKPENVISSLNQELFTYFFCLSYDFYSFSAIVFFFCLFFVCHIDAFAIAHIIFLSFIHLNVFLIKQNKRQSLLLIFLIHNIFFFSVTKTPKTIFFPFALLKVCL